MEELFVTYEIALKLKELNYNNSYFGEYVENSVIGHPTLDIYQENDYSLSSENNSKSICECPMWQQVFDYFEDKYNLYVEICPDRINLLEKKLFQYRITSIDESIILDEICDQHYWIRKGCFKSKFEAKERSVLKMIESVLKKR